MLLDVSSLEVARQKSADLDKEFRTNGFANILAAVAGGAGGNLSLNGALLIEKSGAVGRLGGVFAALVCAVVLFAGADIGAMVPKAILMGMLAYLGVTILAETLHSPAQSSLAEWALGRRHHAGDRQFRIPHGRGARRDWRLPDVRAEL